MAVSTLQSAEEQATASVRARVDGELRVALDRLATAAYEFVFVATDSEGSMRVTRDAYCRALVLMRDRGWPPERALIACGRVTDSHTRNGSVDARHEDRVVKLRAQLLDWLLQCYYHSA